MKLCVLTVFAAALVLALGAPALAQVRTLLWSGIILRRLPPGSVPAERRALTASVAPEK